MTIALVAERMVTLPKYTDTESKSGQLFHNFLDMMVRAETYPDVAARFNEMLQSVEDECVADTARNAGDKVEEQWLNAVRSLRMFLDAVVEDVEKSGESRGIVIPVSFKNDHV